MPLNTVVCAPPIFQLLANVALMPAGNDAASPTLTVKAVNVFSVYALAYE